MKNILTVLMFLGAFAGGTTGLRADQIKIWLMGPASVSVKGAHCNRKTLNEQYRDTSCSYETEATIVLTNNEVPDYKCVLKIKDTNLTTNGNDFCNIFAGEIRMN